MFPLARGGCYFLILLLDTSSVMGESDVQAYYFYLERKKNMVGALFFLKVLFIHYVPCLSRREMALGLERCGQPWALQSPSPPWGAAFGGSRAGWGVGEVGWGGHTPLGRSQCRRGGIRALGFKAPFPHQQPS